MYKRLFFPTLLIFLFFTLEGCSSQPGTIITPPQYALDRAVRIGKIIIAGQPTESEIRSLSQKRISNVINVRTPEEMNDSTQVHFDEAKLVTDAHIVYTQLPLGGKKYPYRPEVLEDFIVVLQASTDSVLVHCKSGGRARWLYAAYEMKYLGKSPDEVMRALEPYELWPLPLEKLTGIPLRIDTRK